MNILKPVSEEDIIWIAEVYEEVGEISIKNYKKTQNSIYETAQRIKSWLNDKSYKILVAYEIIDNQNTPVAVVIAVLQKSQLDETTEAFIELHYVVASMRNKGLGERLMNEILKWGQKHKAQRVKTYVSFNNTQMIRLCKRLGYCESYITMEKNIM